MTGGVTRMAAATHDTLGTYQALFLGSFAVAQMAVVLRVTLRPPTAPWWPGRVLRGGLTGPFPPVSR